MLAYNIEIYYPLEKTCLFCCCRTVKAIEKSIGMETNLFQVSWATKIKFRDKLIHIALGFYNQELNWQGDAEIVFTLVD